MRVRHQPDPDPIAGLSRRDRRAWRRTADRIAAEHDQRIAAQLAELRYEPIIAVITSPLRIVSLLLPTWQVTLADVFPRSRAVEMMLDEQCQITGTGRYGRLWWITVAAPVNERRGPAGLLATRLRLARTGGTRLIDCPSPAIGRSS